MTDLERIQVISNKGERMEEEVEIRKPKEPTLEERYKELEVNYENERRRAELLQEDLRKLNKDLRDVQNEKKRMVEKLSRTYRFIRGTPERIEMYKKMKEEERKREEELTEQKRQKMMKQEEMNRVCAGGNEKMYHEQLEKINKAREEMIMRRKMNQEIL